MKKYYLVTTDHLAEGLWFRDERDFIAGMNFVAIQAYKSNVTVLAFILVLRAVIPSIYTISTGPLNSIGKDGVSPSNPFSLQR